MFIHILAAAGGAAAGVLWSRRRQAARLRELLMGLQRWTYRDLELPLSLERMKGHPELVEAFDRAQRELRGVIEEGRLELMRERIKIETLFASLPDGLVITNLRGEVLFVNPPALDILGIRVEDLKAAGRGLLEPSDPDRFRMPVQEILKNHTHSQIMEIVSPKNPGARPNFYRTTVTMFSTPGGGDFGVLLMLRDVTGERRLAELKEEFFQAVAHDLRAPLFAMQGYLRLLEKSVSPMAKHQKGYFDAISQSCEKLTLFIQDTLDAARIETGQLTLAVTPIDPKILLQRVVRLFGPLAEEKGIKMSLEISQDCPSRLDADERLLERVFNNLLSNALKFTPRGGAISIALDRAGSDQAEFCVSDTGSGIAPEQRTRIFERFHQADSGQGRSGFGLGLNICMRIVKLHHGTIWVDSEPGLGSQFVFRIPIKQSMGDENDDAR